MPAHYNHPWTMKEDLHTRTKPKTQFDNYRFLMKLQCVTTLKRHRLYQSLSDHHNICGSCYTTTPANLKPIYAFVVLHSLIHRDSMHYQENCTTWWQRNNKRKPADECRGCIEEFRCRPSITKSKMGHAWSPHGSKNERTVTRLQLFQFETQHFVSGDTQAVISFLVAAHKHVSFPLKEKKKKKKYLFFLKGKKTI